MHENRLLMNETKTEFLLIGTKQQLTKVNVDHVKVGNADNIYSPAENRKAISSGPIMLALEEQISHEAHSFYSQFGS